MTDPKHGALRADIETYAARHGLDPAPLIALLLVRDDAGEDALPEPADLRPQVLHPYPH